MNFLIIDVEGKLGESFKKFFPPEHTVDYNIINNIEYDVVFIECDLCKVNHDIAWNRWWRGWSNNPQDDYLSDKNLQHIVFGSSEQYANKFHNVFKLLKNDLNILFGNENEINELMKKNNLLNSMNELKSIDKLIIITRSENGSVALLNDEITYCESTKVEKVLDLTGAGDLFAAGFLKEYLDKSNIKNCLQAGSKLAAKIIQKVGARLN